jgi:hypothetical protein
MARKHATRNTMFLNGAWKHNKIASHALWILFANWHRERVMSSTQTCCSGPTAARHQPLILPASYILIFWNTASLDVAPVRQFAGMLVLLFSETASLSEYITISSQTKTSNKVVLVGRENDRRCWRPEECRALRAVFHEFLRFIAPTKSVMIPGGVFSRF